MRQTRLHLCRTAAALACLATLPAVQAQSSVTIYGRLGRAGKNGAVADSEASQFTLAYNYKLSKRTKVYTFYTRLDDGDAGLYGGDFSSVAFGIRHNF